MNQIISVKVSIAGRDYSLRTDDSPEYLQETAADLDSRIKSLLKENPSFGIQNAAVIAALTSLDEARKANEAIDNIRGQIKAYVADAAKTRAAKDKLNERIKALEATVNLLEKAVKTLEKENAELKKNRSPFQGEQLVLGEVTEESEKSEPEAPAQETKDAADEAAGEKPEDKPTGTEDKESPAEDGQTSDRGDEYSIDDEIAGYLDEGKPENTSRRKRKRKH